MCNSHVVAGYPVSAFAVVLIIGAILMVFTMSAVLSGCSANADSPSPSSSFSSSVSSSSSSPNAAVVQTPSGKPALELLDDTLPMRADGLPDYEVMLESKLSKTDSAEAKIVPSGNACDRPSEKEWTIMVYMVGSNLESQFGLATDDLREMQGAGVDFSKSNVVVYAGGSKRWNCNVPNWQNAVLDLSRPEEEWEVASTARSADMGAPKTFSAFVNWAVEERPARHYALVFWDHGAGPVWGFGSDELNGNDSLLLSEIRKVMKKTPFSGGRKLDLVGFDACLMASAENVLMWKDFANWMVASEEVEDGDGWDWSFLAELNGDPDASSLAARIVESFRSYYEAKATLYSNPDATLAAFDLSKAGELETALSDFAQKLSKMASGDGYSDLNRCRAASRMLGLSAVSSKGSGYDLVDLRDLIKHLSDVCKPESATLESAIDSCIAACSSNAEGANGLSVYFPGDNYGLYAAAGKRILDIQPKAMQNLASIYAKRWQSVLDVDWTLPKPKLSADGSEYLLQLTAEQVASMSDARYSVLKSAEDHDGYNMTTCNVPAVVDDSGVLHIPADPAIVVAVSKKEAEGALELPMACVGSSDQALTFQSLSLGIASYPDLVIGPSSWLPVSTTMIGDVGEGDLKVKSILLEGADGVPLGRNTLDVEHYTDLAVLYVPISPSDDQSLPFLAWDRVQSLTVAFLSLDGVAFRYVHLSDPVLCKVSDEYIGQVTITDVNGTVHGSSTIKLESAKESRVEAIETAKGSLQAIVFDDHAEIVGYKGDDTRLVFPSEVSGVPVTCIDGIKGKDRSSIVEIVVPNTVERLGNSVFASMKSLESVEFEGNLIEIGARAFSSCNALKQVRLPDTVKSIGNAAFRGSGIESIVVPASVEEIGGAAFARCLSLYNIDLDPNNEHFCVVDGVLFSADKKTLCAFPSAREGSYTTPNYVEAVAVGSFSGSKLTSITVSEGVKQVGDAAFDSCDNLRQVDLPSSLEVIGDHAFGSLLGNIEMLNRPPHIDKIWVGPNVSYIGDNAFAEHDIGSIEVDGGNAKYSSKGGFLLNKRGDTLLQVPAGMGSVIKIPDGVTTLLEKEFFEYRDDVDFFLPNSLYQVPENAFDERSENPHKKPARIRFHCEKGSAMEDYAKSFGIEYDNETDVSLKKSRHERVEIDGVFFEAEVYGDRAIIVNFGDLEGHESKELHVPENIGQVPVTAIRIVDPAEISYEDLGECSASVVVLPLSLQEIVGIEHLRASYSIQEFKIEGENDYFTVKDGILYSKDETVLVRYPPKKGIAFEIPQTVERIADYAFFGSALADVAIPDSVEYIGASAFGSCKLERVDIPGSVQEVGENAFSSCSLRKVAFHEGLEIIGNGAFEGNELQELELPDSVKRVGRYAFAYNKGFNGLVLPRGLEYVGGRAFGADSSGNLFSTGSDTLVIGPALEEIDQDAFVGIDVKAFEVDEDNGRYSADGPLLLVYGGSKVLVCASGAKGAVHVPEGVMEFETGAFKNAAGVTDVYFPDSVTEIKDFAELFHFETKSNNFESNPRKRIYKVRVHSSRNSPVAKEAQECGIEWVEV